MYITKIIIENFQSYYGKQELSLDKNLNLVLGTNAAGKSKLFNAFYWNFFGEIYKINDGWCPVDMRNFLAIFNKMKLKESEENDIVKATSEIHLVADKQYVVTHSIEIKKINGNDFTNQKNWKLLSEDRYIYYDDDSGNSIIIDNDFNVIDYINKKLLPKDISKYIWFQGETLDDLIDIRDGKTFQKAINFVSYIGYYEKNINLIEDLIDKVERTLRKKKKKDTSNEKEFNRLNDEIEKLEAELGSKNLNLENKKKELVSVEEAIEEIDKRLDDIDEYINYKNKKDSAEREREYILNRMEQLDKNKSNNFSKNWILLGTVNILRKGFNKLQTYQKVYEETQNNNPSGLPYDVPPPDYLKDMLNQKLCFLCNRKFDSDIKEHKDTYDYIKQRLQYANAKIEDIKKANRENLAINNKIVELLSYQTPLLNKANSVQEEIKENQKENSELNNRKIEIIDNIKEIDDEITKLQNKHGQQMTDKFSKEKSDYNYNTRERDTLKTTIRHIEERISEKKLLLRNKKAELDNIPTITKSDYIEESILKYLNYLKNKYVETKEKEFEKLMNKIEEKANEILEKTTRANKVINGRINIDRDTFMIQLQDLDTNNKDRDLNTGHITLMKMCIINAMVLISNEYKNKAYPFISDAPTSALDDGTTKLYYKVLDEEFEQSISMTKDLFTYRDGYNVVPINSLKDFDFKNVYLIERSGDTNKPSETNSYSQLEKII